MTPFQSKLHSIWLAFNFSSGSAGGEEMAAELSSRQAEGTRRDQHEGILSIKFSLKWFKIFQWKLLISITDYLEKEEKYPAWCLKETPQKRQAVSTTCLLECWNFSFICNKILTLKTNLLHLIVKFSTWVKIWRNTFLCADLPCR